MALQNCVLLSLVLGAVSLLQMEGDHTLLFRGRGRAAKCTRTEEKLRVEGEGVSYMGTMHLGGQPLDTIWDTGSTELVVNSDKTLNMVKPCVDKWKKHCYSAYLSLSYQRGKALPKMISYGSGDTMVQPGKDVVSLVGDKCACETNFQELLTTNIPNILTHQIDVVAGLGPTSVYLKTSGITTFSFCFPANTEKDGFLIWNSHIPAGGTKVPVTGFGKNNYWAVPMTDVSLSSNPEVKACEKTCNAIVDTGTSLLTLDKKTLNMFTNELNKVEKDLAKKGYKCTAETIKMFPTMNYKLNGQTFTFQPKDYMAVTDKESEIPETMKGVMDAMAKKLPWMAKFTAPSEGKQCVLMFTKPMEEGVAILGMPFFRNYKCTFDTATNAIYAEPHNGNCLRGKSFRQLVNQSDTEGHSWPSWEAPEEDKIQVIDPTKIVFGQAYHDFAKRAGVHAGIELVSAFEPLKDGPGFSLLQEEEKVEVPEAKLSLRSKQEKKEEPSAEYDPEIAALVANLYDN